MCCFRPRVGGIACSASCGETAPLGCGVFSFTGRALHKMFGCEVLLRLNVFDFSIFLMLGISVVQLYGYICVD